MRSCDIIRAINRLYPDVRVNIVTALGEEFFRSRLDSPQNTVRAASFDVGMVQKDAIRVDVEATLAQINELYAQKAALLLQERDYLQQEHVGVVVSDIPGMPIEAAASVGLPSIAVGNFSWDWIYSPFAEVDPRWEPIVTEFQSEYAKADLLLRLPFYGDMSAFRRSEDVPLLASPGRSRRNEIADRLGLPADQKWVLLSFTSLDWDDDVARSLTTFPGHVFITVKPLDWSALGIAAIDRREFSFQDAIASVDVVVSKPGYGILSECIANEKPFIYADREHFIEYPVLVENVKRYLRNVHIPAEDLYKGNLRRSLEQIQQASEPPERLARGGDEIAAHRIMSMTRHKEPT